jgi:hypothetical protein
MESETASRVVAVIPTSGVRPALGTVIGDLLDSGRVDEVVVALNGPEAPEGARRIVALRTGVRVIEVASGYSSSRNEGVDEAIGAGAAVVLLVDDDVALPSTSISAWVDQIEAAPNALVALPVFRYSERASPLFDVVFADRKWQESSELDFLPATCLSIPASVWKQGMRFNPALDRSGAEDTEYSWRLKRMGVPLVAVTEANGIEIHPASRLDSRDLLMRVAVSTFVLRALRAGSVLETTGRPPSGAPGIATIVAALGVIARVAPRLALNGARAVGVLLWRRREVPAKRGSQWLVQQVR